MAKYINKDKQNNFMRKPLRHTRNFVQKSPRVGWTAYTGIRPKLTHLENKQRRPNTSITSPQDWLLEYPAIRHAMATIPIRRYVKQGLTYRQIQDKIIGRLKTTMRYAKIKNPLVGERTGEDIEREWENFARDLMNNFLRITPQNYAPRKRSQVKKT
ncbi:MAG: hypothetical protein PHD95_03790 [Candidatus ainarchaeum sp.]|nr:hypothetical protein [Candidatus ainarchaeum sp.]